MLHHLKLIMPTRLASDVIRQNLFTNLGDYKCASPSCINLCPFAKLLKAKIPELRTAFVAWGEAICLTRFIQLDEVGALELCLQMASFVEPSNDVKRAFIKCGKEEWN